MNGSIDWSAVASSGIQFAYTRVSDGTAPDTAFDQNYTAIKAAGLARGAIQFFRPAQDPAAQAGLLLQKIGTLHSGDLPPALDVEVTDAQSPATIAAHVQTWATMVQNGIGRPPVIFTSLAFWNSAVQSSIFGSNPLWIGQFGGVCPNIPAAWQNWTFWLYSPNGFVPGISVPSDVDEFNGTVTDLQNLSIVPFASFQSLVEIAVEGFGLQGYFTLGIPNHAIDPLHENVTVQLANFSAAIPPGSFTEPTTGRFHFEGVINGAILDVEIMAAPRNRFIYVVGVLNVDLTSVTNPVTTTLTIGNQRGTATTNAFIQP